MKKQKPQGYVLIIVMVLVSILMATAYYFGEGLFTELIIARNNKGAAVAFSLAEAGVQEAIYRVQYESEKETFMNSEVGESHFWHDQALISNGSYDVTIKNAAKGAATITSIGSYKIGATRFARREIKVGIAQANINPYPYEGGIFTGGGAGESIADVDVWSAKLNIFGGSLLSNRDINYKFGAIANIEKTVEAERNVIVKSPSVVNCACLISGLPSCGANPGCAAAENQPPKTMPPIDFNSSLPTSYISQAKNHIPPQYFERASDFLALVPKNGSATFDGVVYVDDSLDIDFNRQVTINGVLVASGSINVSKGSITINRPDGNASGVLSEKDLKIGSNGNLTGTGLIYTGDRVQIDSSNSLVFDLTGGILSRRTWLSGYRVVNIHYEPTVINTTLGNPIDTPVIEINHWEEEY